jgi:hypothetical protein
MKTTLKFEAMEPGADFCAAETTIRKMAEEEFLSQPHDDNKRFREDLRRYQREVAEQWFAVQPLYASITVRSDTNSDEIRDEWFNGSITVYGPHREFDYAAQRAAGDITKACYRIQPGYVNASSWSAGTGNASAAATRQELQHRMKMMEMAVSCLNRRNELCLEWEVVENPFEKAREWDKLKADEKRKREKEYAERAELMNEIHRYLTQYGEHTAKEIAKTTEARLAEVESALQTLVMAKRVLTVGKSGLYRAQLPLPLAEVK